MSQDTTESKSSAVESISALEFMTTLLADHKIMQIDEIGSGEKEDSWKQFFYFRILNARWMARGVRNIYRKHTGYYCLCAKQDIAISSNFFGCPTKQLKKYHKIRASICPPLSCSILFKPRQSIAFSELWDLKNLKWLNFAPFRSRQTLDSIANVFHIRQLTNTRLYSA